MFQSTPNIYQQLKERLAREPRTWLVTGVAGFIGSNLLETLLRLDQRVVGLDNFATGRQHNLDLVQATVAPRQWRRFVLREGDIRRAKDCSDACQDVDYVLHQAALGSVPRSIADPLTTNGTNITGFLNMLDAARKAGVKSFTYAASSSTYGDHLALPKVEENIGRPLSPYAVTKYVNELYAEVFSRTYGFHATGLRYFNVFGPRQDPNGAYAAVIPKWIAAMLIREPVFINGDGETSRDFCYVDNAVQANLLAATRGENARSSEVFNTAVGDQTTLKQLFTLLQDAIVREGHASALAPIHRAQRTGDVRHSRADISKAQKLLGYVPTHRIAEGIAETVKWYMDHPSSSCA